MTGLFTLLPEAVGTIRADTKAAILEQIAERFGGVYGLDQAMVLERIEEREKLGSTGFGRGVAIPHARIEGLARPVAIVLRLEAPVDFDAADGMPVDIVFGLLSPEQAGAAHLHVATTVVRRAERSAWAALAAYGDQPGTGKGEGGVNPLTAKYLNRLSDLLFILARQANVPRGGDVLWQPGGGRVEKPERTRRR